MQDITTTRHNPQIDPFVHVWGWEIPVYLFLGGLVAGMMIISGYFLFSKRFKETSCACYTLPLISLILLSFGMFALFLDLEHKLYVWRLYTTFRISSPMSWGAWILILVYPAIIANLLIGPPEFLVKKFSQLNKITTFINERQKLIQNIGVVNMLLGGMLGIYTGVLLSTMGSRPLWNSSILSILFLVSGLSTAAAFVHMIAKNVYERELLAKADNGFLVIELFVIMLLLIGLSTSSAVHISAAKLLISGEYAPQFWTFVIGMGIVIPLIIQLLAVNHKIKHTPIAPIMVILGGLILRFIIVYAGQYSHYLNAHFK
ncbi:MAG: polysulfide reductase NrfD [Melioribacter sp.]|uniref:NrfD/PsrC family molybdoenzyme membrane anchor subunit n=1 Tax=Rosettibacter primus TaxID=3111523 RepID=UPI00247C8331|nr:polysulfide reductase NrfD [Melioribacter sp.]